MNRAAQASRRALAEIGRRPNLLAGTLLVGAVIGLGLIASLYTPYDVTVLNIRNRLTGPTPEHWLGTDALGRDLVSMIMMGARNSLIMAIVAVGLGLAVGVPLGLTAAMRPGPVQDVIMRLTDLTFAFPAVLTAVLIAALAGPGVVNAVLAVGIFNIAVFARVTRGAAIGVLGRPFVTAALAIGRTARQIAVIHVLPNIAGVLIVQATVQFAIAILAEAALSYLGLGVQPPDPSWGKMLRDAQTLMYTHPEQAIVPGVAIAVAVLGFNLLGDGLRDALDPRMRVWRLS